jgi:hypothetical protein
MIDNDHGSIIRESQSVIYPSPRTELMGIGGGGERGKTNQETHLRRTPKTQVLRLAWHPLILERRRKIKLLALVRGTFGHLNAEAGIPEEVGRVGHAQRVLAFLREPKDAGQVRGHLVEEGIGDRWVLEVEEADVDEGVSELLDKDGPSVRGGE